MASNALSARISNFLGLLGDIRDSDVYDSRWYRRQSVGARLSPSPLLHYMLVGWRQGLNPSPRFDTRFYIKRYRDVRESRSNPLTHYMIHGRDEGRLATRSGRIFRETLYPEYAPLPVFGAPFGDTRRLTVVIDDHSPRLLGVGYIPLLGLAVHTAAQAGFSLRVLIRSSTITTADISDALNAAAEGPRPTIDISRRTPGPTDDVDATDTEVWWASSASSFASLNGLVAPHQLWWVMTADELSRTPAGEHREAAERLLSDPHTTVIAVGDVVASSVPKKALAHTVSVLPTLVPATPSASPRLGVVVCPDQPESLPATATRTLEYALTHGHVSSPVTLLGLEWEPLTFSGSVVVDQVKPKSAAEWASALSSVSSLLIAQSGTEQPWLADQLSTSMPVVSGSGAVEDLAEEIATAKKAKPVKVPTWNDIAARIATLVEKARG